MFGSSGSSERSGEIYLPYVGHITEQAVLLRDGSLMAMGHLTGLPFELEEAVARNARLRNLNTLFRNIADDNVTVCTHMVRHPDVSELPPSSFRSSFAAGLDAAYRERVLNGRLFRNEHYLTVVLSPRNLLGKAGSKLARFRRGDASSGSDRMLRALEELWEIIANGMEAFGVRRLGLREKQDVVFTEIGEALRLMISCRWMPVPVVSGSLGASIYTDRVICGKRGFEVRAPAGSYVGSMYSFREYPARTRPGMLNTLLSADFPCILSQSYSFLTRAQAHGVLSLKSAQMLSSGDKASSQIEGLSVAEDEIASNSFVMGSHHLSLAVYAEDLQQLGDCGARARARLTDAGAVVVQEGLGMEAAFWSQLPGNIEWRTRPGAINSRNFAAFAGLDNYPGGSRHGHWGSALARFRTDGGTPYDYIPHVKDVGMTAIFGPIGSGKTVFLTYLLAMLEQALVEERGSKGSDGRKPGSVFFFDKDRGGELLVLATGGNYLVLRRGERSGAAPLIGLDDSPASQDFLREWITGLIESDGKGPISSEEGRRLQRGIQRQLSFPKELRSIGGLREFLLHGPAEGAGARLERWCRGNALGWAFDGDMDDVRVDSAITGFDMTHLLDYEEVCAPMAAYLLHRVSTVVDGRRFVMSCDEFRAYLLNPAFASVVDKFLLTIRKNNGILILATQQPEHVLESPLGSSLVAQCMTKILFPSESADHHAYVQGLKCTEGEFKAVREDMAVGKRRFLLKREAGSVICEFDLSSMPEFIAVLSGRANTVRFAEKLRGELGEDPSAWLGQFMARYKEAKD